MKVGNKADGADFFDRDTEREDLWRYLAGNHIVLSGPRRLGKTSLLQRLADEAEDKGYLAQLIDLEGIDSAEDFLGEIDRAFPEKAVARWIKNAGDFVVRQLNRARKVDVQLPDGVSVGVDLQGVASPRWQQQAVTLQRRLSPAPVLLLLDEFSVFLEKMLTHDVRETERLLGWLRAWRQQGNLSCRVLFSGSIGINSLLDRYRLSTRFNDCHDFRLGPFKRQAALAMLAEETRREGWPPDAGCLEHLCDRVGWLSPFFLNLLLDGTIIAARDRLQETEATPGCLRQSDVDDAYDRLLATRSRFIHWRQRLERDLEEPRRSFALAVLSAVAKPDGGLSRKQLLARLQRLEPDPDKRADRLDDILLLLEEDGYLATDERICFLSFLLRDYWRRNHDR
ncbi:MAG: hypothetical protein BWK76_27745 [Desulfobulbaceae bacterium A2]|nr:MAG: hypothetical protein BWK76_27745 [Desulfobulbaceae bacterium A2]